MTKLGNRLSIERASLGALPPATLGVLLGLLLPTLVGRRHLDPAGRDSEGCRTDRSRRQRPGRARVVTAHIRLIAFGQGRGRTHDQGRNDRQESAHACGHRLPSKYPLMRSGRRIADTGKAYGETLNEKEPAAAGAERAQRGRLGRRLDLLQMRRREHWRSGMAETRWQHVTVTPARL
jgi:hypothetical protein